MAAIWDGSAMRAMTLTPEREAEIRAFAVDDDTCVGHCLAVRDLLDEVAALRRQVTRLLAEHADLATGVGEQMAEAHRLRLRAEALRAGQR